MHFYVPGATLPTHVGRAPVTVNPNPVLPRTIESVWRLPFAHCCSVSISISDMFTDQCIMYGNDITLDILMRTTCLKS